MNEIPKCIRYVTNIPTFRLTLKPIIVFSRSSGVSISETNRGTTEKHVDANIPVRHLITSKYAQWIGIIVNAEKIAENRKNTATDLTYQNFLNIGTHDKHPIAEPIQ